MRAPLLLLGGIVVLSVAVARALSCVCSPLECDILTDDDCPGGLTWDPCRCCKVCARVEGEPCGGLFGFSGSCAVGLQCVIKNLLHHTGEVDEGVCAKIPGRWRRHCPRGPVMSGPGCNLVGDGSTGDSESVLPTDRCVCGPSVLWCPDEPPPYVYTTHHECKLNLDAKMAYDDFFNSGDVAATAASIDAIKGASLAAECPEDSAPDEHGACKCNGECPLAGCRPGQRPVQVRAADPETPGNCCPRYNCISPDGSESCPEDSVLTKDGECKCLPCLPASCRQGQRPVEVKAATPGKPGSCCRLYDCKPSESVSWATMPSDDAELLQYCFHNGEAKVVGERWQKSACESCICEEDGRQSCQSLMCKSCDNAIPPDPGECCPHCPPVGNTTEVDPISPCTGALDNCELRCDHGYINDENNCPTCKCALRKEDTSVDQLTTEVEKSCADLEYCGLSCILAKDERGCKVCSCQTPRPTVNTSYVNGILLDENGRKVCPEVKCDLHCEHGLVMDENDCTFCECKSPAAACPPLVGCRKRCAFGYKTNKRGCPTCRCRASCTDHLNQTHPEGSSWYPNACTTCICEAGGRLSCKETICSVACSNPLPPKPGTCCPVCPITGTKEGEPSSIGSSTRGWGTVPITLIVILAVLCLLLIVHIVRSRFRGRLSPSEANYSSYPPQYYKCVPAYDTPVHRTEKIVPL